MLIVFLVVCLAMIGGGTYWYHRRELTYAHHGLDTAIAVVGIILLFAIIIVSFILIYELVSLPSLDERISVCEEYAESLRQLDFSSDYDYYCERAYVKELKKIRNMKKILTRESEYRWWLYFGSANKHDEANTIQ